MTEPADNVQLQILSLVQGLRTDMDQMRTGMLQMRVDMDGMRADINQLQTDMRCLHAAVVQRFVVNNYNNVPTHNDAWREASINYASRISALE